MKLSSTILLKKWENYEKLEKEIICSFYVHFETNKFHYLFYYPM